MGVEHMTGERLEHALAEDSAESRHHDEVDVVADEQTNEFRCVAVAVEIACVASSL
jgi:hypothetical protein